MFTPNTQEYQELEVPIFILGILTQAIFFAIELVQLRFRWRTYLQESFWNWIEFSQFFVYIAYAVEGSIQDYKEKQSEDAVIADATAAGGRLLKTVGKSSSTQTSAPASRIMDVEPFNVIILILILAVGGFAKILYFIRIFKDYGFIV